jgi:serine/threonine protein kinase
MIVGTPDYMSPEQVKGLPLDRRSDLVSFGVILAAMVSGRHPFRQPSTLETLSAVLREPPALSGDMLPAMTTIVRHLLAKDVSERYGAIAEVQADFAVDGMAQQRSHVRSAPLRTALHRTARDTEIRSMTPTIASLFAAS